MEFLPSSDQMNKKDNAPKTLLELLKEEKASQKKGESITRYRLS